MYGHRLNDVAPEIMYLGPLQPPGTTFKDGCQNVFRTIDNLLDTIDCEIFTKEKLKDIRRTPIEKDTTLWEYYVSPATVTIVTHLNLHRS